MTEDGASEWQDVLADEGVTPDDTVMETRDGEARSLLVRESLQDLSERERTIIRERLLVEEPITLEALGRRLGISKERVRQIEASALAKLKRAMIARVGDPVEAGYIGR